MAMYDATPEWLKKHGLKANDARRLFNALCTLADFEWAIKGSLSGCGMRDHSHSEVCSAIRHLVDMDLQQSCNGCTK